MSAREPLSRNVKALGAVSLLADIASEMTYALLPIFLSATLGAGASLIGAIEGAAQSASSFLKLASGWWSDRVGTRKPFVIVGYVLAAIVRPLIGLAAYPWHVLVIRLCDRAGKGIRTSPRDALLADSASPTQRGRAFGFHRAADNVGGVVGPLLAWVMLERATLSVRSVFLWTAVPGALSVLVLLFFVRERAVSVAAEQRVEREQLSTDLRLGPAFWRYMAVLLLFTLGNSSDLFLLLRASQVGVPTAMVPVLWAAFNLVKALASTPSGTLSDRVGRRPLIVWGWVVYAAVYLLFAHATAPWHIWALFLAYGAHFGLTEGVEKALVADVAPAARRGTAFGWYNFVIGLGALPASVIFGLVYQHVSPMAAFTLGATLAGVAAVGLVGIVPAKRRER